MGWLPRRGRYPEKPKELWDGVPKKSGSHPCIILKDEEIKLNCSVFNSSKEEIEATPNYQTRHRSSFGEVVDQAGGDLTSILFNSEEQKVISVTLPKATVPQSYDVNFSLKNSIGESNVVTIHYVLAGDSATIQSLSLDKDYYAKGDIANLTLLWAPRADAFPNNRLNTKVSDVTVITLSAEITNKYGKSCAKPIVETLPRTATQATTEIPVSITSECDNPKLSLTLSDQNGNILDQKEFNVDSTTTPESKGLSTNAIIIIIVVVILIILLGFYFKKKGNSPDNSDSNLEGPTGDNNNVVAGVLFLIALFGLASFGFNKIEIVKAAAPVDSPQDTERPAASLVTNIDKDAYFVGESITATGTARLGICSNAIDIFNLSVNIDGGFAYDIVDRNLDAQIIYGSVLIPINSHFSIGEHTARFTLQVDNGTIEQTKTFTVLPRPTVNTFVNGKKTEIIPVGSSAVISWQATNATIGCECTLSPAAGSGASCGSSPADVIYSGDKTVTNITQRTTVSVKCISSDYAPPSETTTKVIGGLDAL